MKINSDFFNSKRGIDLLSNLFRQSGEGIMVFDANGRILAMNPRAEGMFGYKENALLGETVERIVPQEHRHAHVAHREKYVNAPAVRSMGAGMDLKGTHKDGHTFPIEISLSHLSHEDEMVVVAFITDIALRKEHEKTLEEQRIKLEAYAFELEADVRDRTRELEHLNLGLQSQIHERKLAESELKKSLQELKKAEKEILKALGKERELSELKSRFVSMASHEFRTPLTTIASSASLITRYPDSEQQENRVKHVDRIQNSVKNLTSILNDFLSLEKLESGHITITKSSVYLPELMEEIVEEMNLFLKKGQHITVTNEANCTFETDPHLLKNLLLNLLSNASKYSDEGDDILLHCTTDKNQVTISVKDTGIGIPTKEQKNLFGRFFRAANATNIQGTGLGLNIVKKYTELLGGTISFCSEEGKGSTFEILLPSHTI